MVFISILLSDWSIARFPVKHAELSEERWIETFQAVNTQFEIESLIPEQQKAIKAFFDGNVLVNLPTIFGKSLIF